MEKNDERKERRVERQANRLQKMKQKLMRLLNPKQRVRFKKLTMTKFFKIKCGSGRKGLKCRRRKAVLLRKIARKVSGRRRRRRRPKGGKRVCKKCMRHLQKFKT